MIPHGTVCSHKHQSFASHISVSQLHCQPFVVTAGLGWSFRSASFSIVVAVYLQSLVGIASLCNLWLSLQTTPPAHRPLTLDLDHHTWRLHDI
jgi:hypothetical protein